jgi:YesN/AraC family two-component response regulator
MNNDNKMKMKNSKKIINNKNIIIQEVAINIGDKEVDYNYNQWLNLWGRFICTSI